MAKAKKSSPKRLKDIIRENTIAKGGTPAVANAESPAATSSQKEWRPEWVPKKRRTLRRLVAAGELPPDFDVTDKPASVTSAELKRIQTRTKREKLADGTLSPRDLARTVTAGQIVITPPESGRVGELSGNPDGPRLGITTEEVIAALKASGGLAGPAAILLGCSSANVRHHMKKPEVQAALKTIEEDEKDEAENQARINWRLGDQAAIQFFLKHKAKERGYGDVSTVKHEHNVSLDAVRELTSGIAGVVAAIRAAAANRPPIDRRAEVVAGELAISGPAGAAAARQ